MYTSNTIKLSNDKQKQKSHEKYNTFFNNNIYLISYFLKFIVQYVVIVVLFFKEVKIQFSRLKIKKP